MISKALGVDIGGSHISAAIIDLQHKKIIPHTFKRNKINAHQEVDQIITAWADVLKEVIGSDQGFSARIGIAIPGPFDYEQGVSLIKGQDKYDALYGLNVKKLLAKKMDLPADHIQMMNDAAAFLQGEVFAGVAVESRRAVGVTLGTGLGSARYIEGNSMDAALWCQPFKAGIAEDYLSTRWFVKRYQEISGKQVSNVKKLSEKYASDEHVVQVFSEFGRNLGEFLSTWISEDKPEVVVLGGNISNAIDFFLPEVKAYLNRNSLETGIKKAALGEEAALIGAASLWS